MEKKDNFFRNLCIFFIIFGAIFCVWGFSSIIKNIMFRPNSVETVARVIDNGKVYYDSHDFPYCWCDIEYDVEGKTYQYGGIRMGADTRVGDKIIVYYDKTNPSNVYVRSNTWENFNDIGLIIIGIGTATYGIYGIIKYNKKNIDTQMPQ